MLARIADLSPLATAAADYDIVRRAIAHIKGNWRSQPEIDQIAEAAGVSTATVDRVLNNRPGVNPTTVHKVREALATLGGGAPVRGRPRC